ncbi:P-loop containing nucleoside triphosphate hydrolase protein [Obelidium mucronatum]|nr:P-loop containing nucleoside triphosphate hydrolase protein [Obelidium mucronatum]
MNHVSTIIRVRPGVGPSNPIDRYYSYSKTVIDGSGQEPLFNHLMSNSSFWRQFELGYSATLIAYGQTGSGKTYSVLGPPGCLTENELSQAGGAIPARWGLLPRILMNLVGDSSLSVLASAVEVYQDSVFDLLAERKLLQVKAANAQGRVDSAIPFSHLSKQAPATFNGVYVHPSSCVCRSCYLERMSQGKNKGPDRAIKGTGEGNNRKGEQGSSKSNSADFATVGETLRAIRTSIDVALLCRVIEATRSSHSHLLNDRSSRSHCVVRLEIHSSGGGSRQKRLLTFVDLAGSERIEKSGSVGVQQQEAIKINQSLSALGKVIKQLGSHSEHVSFRDSTLTMLLRSSFQNNAGVSVILAVAPEIVHEQETLGTLRYGESMRSVGISVGSGGGEHIPIADEEKATRLKLNAVRDALLELKRSNRGPGHYGPAATPSSRTLHEQNSKLYGELKTELQVAKERRLEGDSSNIINLESRLANVRDVLLRQENIAGFWIPPSPGYIQLKAEEDSLLTRLHFLTV